MIRNELLNKAEIRSSSNKLEIKLEMVVLKINIRQTYTTSPKAKQKNIEATGNFVWNYSPNGSPVQNKEAPIKMKILMKGEKPIRQTPKRLAAEIEKRSSASSRRIFQKDIVF